MHGSRRHGSGGRGLRSAATAAAFAALALGMLVGCGGGASLPPRGQAASAPPLNLPPLPPPALAEADHDVAEPVRIRIPSIGVDAAVDPLEVDANNVLPPPATNERTGYWRAGPEPGERGPAVIVGHVDSFQGPAVFFRLTELTTGDQIHVDRADGSTATFVVQRLERHDKNKFPTKAVYGDTPDQQLRLVTCGGEFDDEDRRYLDNIIAFAVRSR